MVEPRLVMALRIVTCWPPEAGVTAMILLTVLPSVVLYRPGVADTDRERHRGCGDADVEPLEPVL